MSLSVNIEGGHLLMIPTVLLFLIKLNGLYFRAKLFDLALIKK